MSRRRRFTICSTILVALITNGCSPAVDGNPSSGANDAETKTDSEFVFETDPVDSGVAEDAGTLDTAPTCTPSGDADDPDDEFKDTNCDGIDGDKTKAVFVSPDGSDEAAGTLDKPLKTLTAAIDRATKDGKDVYACSATYAESLSLTASVRIFGGYDCKSGWKRTLDRATIAPGSGIPVKVTGSATRVRLERVVLRAPDGSAPGESSIALFAANADGVVVTSSLIEAGMAADGLTSPTATAIATPATTGKDGLSRDTMKCNYTTSCTGGFCYNPCKSDAPGGVSTPVSGSCESAGGKGGDAPGYDGTNKSRPAQAGAPGSPSALGGNVPSAQGAGNPGRAGSPGRNGDSSTRGFGSITEVGYAADNIGVDGVGGTAGGGGGGGWSGSMGPYYPTLTTNEYYVGGGGGEGGFGGCGGGGGKGGGGGGASIGVVAWKTKLTLTRTTVRTAGGGRGGNGGGGADGQAGGTGGKGGKSNHPGYEGADGLDGGPGAKGGKGGAGGAGGGGPSIGIAHNGDAPVTDAVTFNVAAGGKGGSSPGGVDAADGMHVGDGIHRFGE